jgi:hypothetical protein
MNQFSKQIILLVFTMAVALTGKFRVGELQSALTTKMVTPIYKKVGDTVHICVQKSSNQNEPTV